MANPLDHSSPTANPLALSITHRQASDENTTTTLGYWLNVLPCDDLGNNLIVVNPNNNSINRSSILCCNNNTAAATSVNDTTIDRDHVFLRLLGPAFSISDFQFMHKFADHAIQVDKPEVWEVLHTMEDLLNDIVAWRFHLLQMSSDPKLKKKNKFHQDDKRFLLFQACYNSFIQKFSSNQTKQNITTAISLFFELKARLVEGTLLGIRISSWE